PAGGRHRGLGVERSAAVPLRRQGTPTHHAQPAHAEPRGGGCAPGTGGGRLRRSLGSGPVSAAADGTLRRGPHRTDPRPASASLARGLSVPPSVLAHAGGRRPAGTVRGLARPRRWRGDAGAARPGRLHLPSVAAGKLPPPAGGGGGGGGLTDD